MRKVFVVLLIMLSAAIVSSGQPPDRFPPLLATPAQARGLMMVGGGVPVAEGGGTAFFGYSSTTEDATGNTGVAENDGAGKWLAYLLNNDSGHSGTLTKLRIKFHNEYNSSTSTAFAVYENNAGAIGSLLVRFNAVNLSAVIGYYDITSMADSAPTLNNGTSYWVLIWSETATAMWDTNSSSTVSMKYGTTSYNFSVWPADGDAADGGTLAKPFIYVYISY